MGENCRGFREIYFFGHREKEPCTVDKAGFLVNEDQSYAYLRKRVVSFFLGTGSNVCETLFGVKGDH